MDILTVALIPAALSVICITYKINKSKSKKIQNRMERKSMPLVYVEDCVHRIPCCNNIDV